MVCVSGIKLHGCSRSNSGPVQARPTFQLCDLPWKRPGGGSLFCSLRPGGPGLGALGRPPGSSLAKCCPLAAACCSSPATPRGRRDSPRGEREADATAALGAGTPGAGAGDALPGAPPGTRAGASPSLLETKADRPPSGVPAGAGWGGRAEGAAPGMLHRWAGAGRPRGDPLVLCPLTLSSPVSSHPLGPRHQGLFVQVERREGALDAPQDEPGVGLGDRTRDLQAPSAGLGVFAWLGQGPAAPLDIPATPSKSDKGIGGDFSGVQKGGLGLQGLSDTARPGREQGSAGRRTRADRGGRCRAALEPAGPALGPPGLGRAPLVGRGHSVASGARAGTGTQHYPERAAPVRSSRKEHPPTLLSFFFFFGRTWGPNSRKSPVQIIPSLPVQLNTEPAQSFNLLPCKE